MFTGIITHTGVITDIVQRGDMRVTIACDFAGELAIGESVAVNGCCLTVTEQTANHFSVELSGETLSRTAARWHADARVNLERALKLGDGLDGHLVTGHVDGLALINTIEPSPPPAGGSKGGNTVGYFGAKQDTTRNLETAEHAKAMRKHMTDAEWQLWQILSNKQLGYKFRRQQRVGGYIVDFACMDKKLIIEVDGGQHAQKQKSYDEKRSKFLEDSGYRMLRFWNNEILDNLEGVAEKILTSLACDTFPPPSPPASRGGDSEANTHDKIEKEEYPYNVSHTLTLTAPHPLARFIAEKGSVTLDGVSLTVNTVDDNQFRVNIIPHSWTQTILCDCKEGDMLNLEVDLMARYAARLLQYG